MRITLYLTLTLVLAVGVSTAVPQVEEVEAQVEAQVEVEEHAEEGWSAVAFRWLNVLILFGGLGYLLRQPAAEFFKARSSLIEGGLARAQTAQVEADGRLNDIKTRLAQISSEVDRIQTVADQSSSTERAPIVADAKTEAHRAVTQSAAEVDRIAQGIAQEVRAEAADLLILKAEEQLRRTMTDADRDLSVRKAFERL